MERKVNRNGARPKTFIDWKKVEELLMAACMTTEIAAYFGISTDTLYLRCKKDLGIEYTAFSQQKKAKGDTLLRAKQYQVAMQGDKTMLIWLGKNRINQREEINTNNNVTIKSINYANAGDSFTASLPPTMVSNTGTSGTGQGI